MIEPTIDVFEDYGSCPILRGVMRARGFRRGVARVWNAERQPDRDCGGGSFPSVHVISARAQLWTAARRMGPLRGKG